MRRLARHTGSGQQLGNSILFLNCTFYFITVVFVIDNLFRTQYL